MAGELGYDTGPFVAVATFCDSVIEGKDGVLSIIRVVDRLDIQASGADVPDEMPAGIAQTTLVVILKAGQAKGGQTVRIDLELPDGTTKPGGETQVHFAAGQGGGASFVIPMQIEVTSAGLYWADVKVNGRLVTRVPLEIRYGFTRLPS